jgi:predicted permease
MTTWRTDVRRLLRLDLGRGDPAQDVRDEMETHLALRVEQLVRDGLTPAAARAEAERLFAVGDGTLRALLDEARSRDERAYRRERWEAAWQDVRYAARRLAREPAITAFVLATMALGIGLNVSAFSVADRVLLGGPQHVREPDDLVRLYSRVDHDVLGRELQAWLPHPVFIVLRDGMKTITGMAAYRVDDAMMGSGASSAKRTVARMSSEMFGLLGVRPARGRFYVAAEDADKVVVLGERYWQSELSADPDVIGRAIAIDDEPHTVVGVAPAGFTGPDLGRVDAWRPISVAARNSMNMKVIARLRAGVPFDAAAADVGRLRGRVEETLPAWARWLRGATYHVAPLRYNDAGREPLEAVMARWLAAIAALILVISCANVANLMLARLAQRQRELAVRAALGSGRGRLVRLLGIEAALLAAGAAALSLVLMAVIEPIVTRALFPQGAWEFRLLDLRIIAVTAVIALVAGMLVSVVPAVRAGRHDVVDALRSGVRSGGGRSPLRSGLTVVQATLSVVLLMGAGLFIRSLGRVQAVDLGMDANRVHVVEPRYAAAPRAPGESFSDWVTRRARLERAQYAVLAEAARRVPGVKRAAVSVGVPFRGGVTQQLWIPGRDSIRTESGGGPWVTAVGMDYFATMGTAIRAGRAFTESDHGGSEAVVIVNETMARALWPDRPALGECVVIQDRASGCARVVGVSADIHRDGLRDQPSLQLYVPVGQERGFSGSALLVRFADAGSGTAIAALREALTAADPSIRSIDAWRLADGVAGDVRPFRLGMMAFGLSAALALLVAGLGLYSIMAHAVTWRRHEIGVRLALGARPGSVAFLSVRRGLALAAGGMTLGHILSIGARRWLEPQLFETSATDPAVLTGVTVVLVSVAVFAAWWPARRAMAVNPIEVLRAD